MGIPPADQTGDQRAGGGNTLSESMPGLSVKEAADLIGYHPQTVRKKIKEGTLQARKANGPNGPEWRIDPQDVEELAAKTQPDEDDSEPNLSRMNATLTELKAMIQGIANGQKRLQPAPEEIEARQERQERIEQALAGNVERIEELAAENARLRQELAQEAAEREEIEEEADTLREERDRLQEKLTQERQRTWWEKLTGRDSHG